MQDNFQDMFKDCSKSVFKHLTYKSSNFTFSKKYHSEVLSKYVAEAETLNKIINNFPVTPVIMDEINKDLTVSSIQSTAKIEGNKLSKEEVRQVIESEEKFKERKHLEIKNLKLIYRFLSDIEMPQFKGMMPEKLIKIIHKRITQGIDYDGNFPGYYRNHDVKVGDDKHGGVNEPPKDLIDIQNLMKIFLKWFDNSVLNENPFIQGAIVHLYLGLIHPFGDGNGRTSRVMEGYIFRSHGIKYLPKKITEYYAKEIDAYYWAFSNTIKTLKEPAPHITPFLEFVMKGVVVVLKEILTHINELMKKVILKGYYENLKIRKMITVRQYELIDLMIFCGFNLSHKDIRRFMPIYNNLSTKTLQRDLSHLLKLKLLITKDDKFEINYDVI